MAGIENHPEGTPSGIRPLLGSLQAFISLNAFGGGWYGLAGAEDVPAEWLEGSPFRDYFLPSLFLFLVIGIGFLLAAAAVFARHRFARPLSLAMALILLAWVGIQLSIIGYVSWMQPATAFAGLMALWLARQLAE